MSETNEQDIETAYDQLDETYLADIIYVDSPFYQEQYSYVQSLQEKGTSVVSNGKTITDMFYIRNNQYTVYSTEGFTIYKSSGEINTVEQNSVYTVELINGEFYITDLELQ